jgi:adenine-specific DNA-methyltransferase
MIRAGDPLEGDDETARPEVIDGHPVAWPVRTDGRLGIWRVESRKLNDLIAKGYAQITSKPDAEQPTLRYLLGGTVDRIEAGELVVIGRGDRGQVLVEFPEGRTRRAKTVWRRGRHTAGGSGGTQMVNQLLGSRDRFSFPKSVYAVQDCLAVAVGDRPDALIVDFFAGSGTTTQSVCLMNRADGGRRRSILVTNNEVQGELADKLHKAGLFTGDADFEANGIFENATMPRVKAAITGERADGEPAEGTYLDGTSIADGLEENCEFLCLGYLDPDRVELGRAFEAIHPILWLRAGAAGKRADTPPEDTTPFFLDMPSGYAVLFDESSFADFSAQLNDAGEAIHTVFLVTDSEDAFAEMQEALGPGVHCSMLYRDYLRSFRIGAGAGA